MCVLVLAEIVCEAPAAEEYKFTNPQDRRMLKFSVVLEPHTHPSPEETLDPSWP